MSKLAPGLGICPSADKLVYNWKDSNPNCPFARLLGNKTHLQ